MGVVCCCGCSVYVLVVVLSVSALCVAWVLLSVFVLLA